MQRIKENRKKNKKKYCVNNMLEHYLIKICLLVKKICFLI